MTVVGHNINYRDIMCPISGGDCYGKIRGPAAARSGIGRAAGAEIQSTEGDSQFCPAGRRFIAARLGRSERVVRGDLDLLREQGLVNCSAAGVRLSARGERVLLRLQSFVRQLHDLEYLEKRLASVLGVGRMIIVPGDADVNPTGQADLALATARYLGEILRDGNILGVTGGDYPG